MGYNEKLHRYYYESDSITHTRTIRRNNLYMIIHYQRWHIPKVAAYLLKVNCRELGRCVKELLLTGLKYRIMKMLKIMEITYES